MKNFFGKHGIAVQSHDFRVTFATDYYEETKDAVQLQALLGHSKLEQTRQYIKSSKEAAVEAQRAMIERRTR